MHASLMSQNTISFIFGWEGSGSETIMNMHALKANSLVFGLKALHLTKLESLVLLL